MPLSWAAGCALGPNVERSTQLLATLGERYHLDPKLMDTLAHFDWREFEGISFEDWDGYLKTSGLYVPLF